MKKIETPPTLEAFEGLRGNPTERRMAYDWLAAHGPDPDEPRRPAIARALAGLLKQPAKRGSRPGP